MPTSCDTTCLFEPLPDESLCLPEDTLAEVNALAEVPREARPAPREGDIFGPDVAHLFRRRLAAALPAHPHKRTNLRAKKDREESVARPVVVNEPLLWGNSNAMSPALARALPPLPEELAYRLVGRDLVLIDVEADLVVDVIRAALPIH